MDRENRVPKLIGGDLELGNFVLGCVDGPGKSDYQASRLLLNEVDGFPRRPPLSLDPPARASEAGFNCGHGNCQTQVNWQDMARRYLCTNGGCIYIDLNHLELATPEVLSARDYQAVWMAMLRIARSAQVAANEGRERARRIVVLANNSDRQGNSYGGHQSFLIRRKTWDDMIRHRMIPSLFTLMAFQVSSIVYTGQGKVGSENGHTQVPFQISQRADFMETLLGEQTTCHRPLVNTRDEPLCGPRGRQGPAAVPGDDYARLHVIFYDTNLAPVATYLKVGVMQLILTMIEAGSIDPDLVLADPLAALHGWSKDPELTLRMPLMSGRQRTAVELQLEFLELARAFDARDGFEGIVPGAAAIIALWEDTLGKLETGAFEQVRCRIDWIMKRSIIQEALAENTQWSWKSPQVRYLDQTYSSLDPEDSLFYALEAQGMFEPVSSEDEIVHFVSNPPANTRAWTRAMLLRAVQAESIDAVHWDRLELATVAGKPGRIRLGLADPLGATRSHTEALFSRAADLPGLLLALHEAGTITVSDLSNIAGSVADLQTEAGYCNHLFH